MNVPPIARRATMILIALIALLLMSTGVAQVCDYVECHTCQYSWDWVGGQEWFYMLGWGGGKGFCWTGPCHPYMC